MSGTRRDAASPHVEQDGEQNAEKLLPANPYDGTIMSFIIACTAKPGEVAGVLARRAKPRALAAPQGDGHGRCADSSLLLEIAGLKRLAAFHAFLLLLFSRKGVFQ